MISKHVYDTVKMMSSSSDVSVRAASRRSVISGAPSALGFVNHSCLSLGLCAVFNLRRGFNRKLRFIEEGGVKKPQEKLCGVAPVVPIS